MILWVISCGFINLMRLSEKHYHKLIFSFKGASLSIGVMDLINKNLVKMPLDSSGLFPCLLYPGKTWTRDSRILNVMVKTRQWHQDSIFWLTKLDKTNSWEYTTRYFYLIMSNLWKFTSAELSSNVGLRCRESESERETEREGERERERKERERRENAELCKNDLRSN